MLTIDVSTMRKLEERITELRGIYGKGEISRIEEVVDIVRRGELPEEAGARHPLVLYFPGLPPKPYIEADEYEELSRVAKVLEKAAPRVRQEYFDAVRYDDLISYEDQMTGIRELRERVGEADVLIPKEQWGTYSLKLGGRRIEEAIAKCPTTGMLLSELEGSLALAGGLHFSVLGPKSGIPPHHDSTNIRITCHLGLVVPEGCGIKVGTTPAREWREGHCMFIDTTYKHEVWNHSRDPRICLFVDVWHPEITEVERNVLSELHALLKAAGTPLI
jgi:Aspartyl/Asparaginyl beta-hydroxylase